VRSSTDGSGTPPQGFSRSPFTVPHTNNESLPADDVAPKSLRQLSLGKNRRCGVFWSPPRWRSSFQCRSCLGPPPLFEDFRPRSIWSATRYLLFGFFLRQKDPGGCGGYVSLRETLEVLLRVSCSFFRPFVHLKKSPSFVHGTGPPPSESTCLLPDDRPMHFPPQMAFSSEVVPPSWPP